MFWVETCFSWWITANISRHGTRVHVDVLTNTWVEKLWAVPITHDNAMTARKTDSLTAELNSGRASQSHNRCENWHCLLAQFSTLFQYHSDHTVISLVDACWLTHRAAVESWSISVAYIVVDIEDYMNQQTSHPFISHVVVPSSGMDIAHSMRNI